VGLVLVAMAALAGLVLADLVVMVALAELVLADLVVMVALAVLVLAESRQSYKCHKLCLERNG